MVGYIEIRVVLLTAKFVLLNLLDSEIMMQHARSEVKVVRDFYVIGGLSNVKITFIVRVSTKPVSNVLNFMTIQCWILVSPL